MMARSLFQSSWALLLTVAAACGGGPFPGGSLAPRQSATAHAPNTVGTGTIPVHIRANTLPFAHQDGLAGQTALTVSGGVRSLKLLRNLADAHPVLLFDHGQAAVEVGYNNGDDTQVAALDATQLTTGHYTVARMVQVYSKYALQATFHDGAESLPGILDDVLVMSQGTLLDGVSRDQGYYNFVFKHEGDDDRVLTGTHAVIPAVSTTAGAVAVLEEGEWAVYYPIDLEIPQSLGTTAQRLVVDVNMDHAFRWEDDQEDQHQPNVFDVTPWGYETVARFGGNTFQMSWE